jgi:hypothetical protein
MNEPVDWTDETLRPLDELARIAFPAGAGVTADTLKRRARQGKLAVYRPGKAYLASLSGLRVMIEKTRVLCAQERAPPRPTPAVPNSLGLTEMDLANMALDHALEELGRPAAEAKRLRDEERARAAPAHRLEMQERRRTRARNRYHERKQSARRAYESDRAPPDDRRRGSCILRTLRCGLLRLGSGGTVAASARRYPSPNGTPTMSDSDSPTIACPTIYTIQAPPTTTVVFRPIVATMSTTRIKRDIGMDRNAKDGRR